MVLQAWCYPLDGVAVVLLVRPKGLQALALTPSVLLRRSYVLLARPKGLQHSLLLPWVGLVE